MGDAMPEGAREGGAEVDIRRVPETELLEVVKAAGFNADTAHPVIESVNAPHDLVLDSKNVFKTLVIPLSPEVRTVRCVDELGSDADVAAALRTLPSTT